MGHRTFREGAGEAMFKKLCPAKRIAQARFKTRRVLEHMLYLVELHENNAMIVYSPMLTAQIPRSFAANAFNLFQSAMHRFEIVRLCALWDGVDPEKENIPTVVELINDDSVIDTLVQEVRAQRANEFVDPELSEEDREALKFLHARFAREDACKARCELTKAISDALTIVASPSMVSIMNLRDKHLAHSLMETRREKRAGPIAPMKYGDERAILSASTEIVEALYRWVNGTGFSFSDSREIDRKNAEALWSACTFNIER